MIPLRHWIPDTIAPVDTDTRWDVIKIKFVMPLRYILYVELVYL
jgi:hypothetical protein